MHAMVIDAFGGPEVMVWREQPQPEPGPGQIRLRVHAAGLNRSDLAGRAGTYMSRDRRPGIYFYPLPPLPATPGIEVAGVVEALGEGVTSVRIGDRVMGVPSTGGYAEQCLMLDWLALPIPDGVDFTEAASLPAAYITAWIALRELADVRPGDRVLIHAAGSAVGVAAVQLARMMGATTIGTAGSQDKLDKAAALGLDQGINYREADFAAVLANAPVDVVMDNVGGDTFTRSLGVMAREGRCVVLSGSAGFTPTLPIGLMLGGRLKVMGMSMAAMLTPERMVRFTREVLRAIPGQLKPAVDRTFAMSDAPDAHRYVDANLNFSKVVLTAS